MSNIELIDKIQNYDKPWCYQYQKRLDTLQEDLNKYGWSQEDLDSISLDDFEFENVTSKTDKMECIEFIKRYEWLGTISLFPVKWFAARYKGILGGVIIMSHPNAFSNLMGENTRDIEVLIGRGASASWCPFNLGSKFLMWCMRWMVDNTQYRLFTCYSDVQAKEIGSIYQALNFYYLGRNSGTNFKVINPYKEGSLISDRTFRSVSFYKRYARELGIEWHSDWSYKSSMVWDNVPDEVEKMLRDYSRKMSASAKRIEFPPKHKYAFVLGRDKRETKALRRKFLDLNKVYVYPKERGI